jgi:hypothetical protein
MWLIALLIGIPMLLYGGIAAIAGNSQDHGTAIIGITCGLLLLVLAIADLLKGFIKGDSDNSNHRRE